MVLARAARGSPALSGASVRSAIIPFLPTTPFNCDGALVCCHYFWSNLDHGNAFFLRRLANVRWDCKAESDSNRHKTAKSNGNVRRYCLGSLERWAGSNSGHAVSLKTKLRTTQQAGSPLRNPVYIDCGARMTSR